MLWLRIAGWLLRVLKEGPTPRQIAGGLVLGWAIGIVPGWPLQVWLLLLLVLILRVNLTMVLAGGVLGAAFGWAAAPALDALGAWVLQDVAALQPLWTALYNSPPWALTRFNNTVVMGSMVVALAVVLAGFPLLVRGVHLYRTRLLPHVQKLRVVQAITGSRLYGLYQRVSQFAGV